MSDGGNHSPPARFIDHAQIVFHVVERIVLGEPPAMPVKVFIEGANNPRGTPGTDGLGGQGFRYDRTSSIDRSWTQLDSGQDYRPSADMTRRVKNHPAESSRVEELIHLRVMRENETIGSEAAMIADADEKAVAHVDKGRGREQYVLSDMHP
jgi:hypothetical protein